MPLDITSRLTHIKNLLNTSNLTQLIKDTGKIYAPPNLVEYMNKPEEPGFQVWAERFVIVITVVFILMGSFQFIDIYSPNLKLIMIFHFVRIFMILGLLGTTFLSIHKGWRTVKINITFQIVVMIIALLISLGAGISKAILFSRVKKKTLWRYASVIFPFLLILVSIYEIISLFISSSSSGLTERPISMFALIFSLLVSFGMSIMQLYNAYYELKTNKKSETDFVSSQDVAADNKKDLTKEPNTIINPVDL
jgi:tryptophan-rich sensory protein